MVTHYPFGLCPVGPWTKLSIVQLAHLLIGCVHSPSKVNWTGLAHGRPAQLTPLAANVYKFLVCYIDD